VRRREKISLILPTLCWPMATAIADHMAANGVKTSVHRRRSFGELR
jgi:hypothetical protein